MSRWLLLALLWCPVPGGFAQVTAPRIGLVRYADGEVYNLSGIQGTYIVGKRLFDDVATLSFSGAGGLLVRQSNLLLLDAKGVASASLPVSGGAAVVGIQDTAETAIAWLPSDQKLVYWTGATFATIDVTPGAIGGQVIAVTKLGQDSAALTVRLTPSVLEDAHISLSNGSLTSRTPIASTAGVFYRSESAILTMENKQLIVTSSSTGSRRIIPFLVEDVQFEAISGTCVHLHSPGANRDWVLDLSGDQLTLLDLPAPPVRKGEP